MKNFFGESGLGPFIIGLIVGIIAGLVAVDFSWQYLQKAAVKAGKAEYYLDADYQRQWRWKP